MLGALRRISLRTRLVVGLIVVVFVGLVAANALVYNKISGYLLETVDTQLVAAAPAVQNALSNGSSDLRFNANTPAGTFGAAYTAAGAIVVEIPNFQGPIPALSKADIATLSSQAVAANATRSFTYRTVGSVGAVHFQYRLAAFSVALTNITTGAVSSGVAVVAIPIVDMNNTLHRLILIDLGVGALLLVLLGVLGYGVVLMGLRPLVDIERTAGAIAAGDLTRRVDREDETSEVGRLGASLNVMLEKIEHSFNEQVASENRLRQFLADASHELRTPVTSIRGYAELFHHGLADRPADLDTAMRRIDTESTRMAGLVDDLLLLARLDQRRPLEREPVDLVTLAGDAAQDARVIDPSRMVTFVSPDACPIMGDEARLRQLFGNLVSNALDYTPAGSPLEIVVEASEGVAQSRVHVSVIDHGPGIPPETAPHVFERFWRSDPARVRALGGTGLGLSIAAAIAGAHGGTVSLTQTPGGGATFSVELPSQPPPQGPISWGADLPSDVTVQSEVSFVPGDV